MTILLVLIPVTLLVLGIAVALFFWAVNHQQFDDLDTPAILPLLDDDEPQASPAPADGRMPATNAPDSDVKTQKAQAGSPPSST